MATRSDRNNNPGNLRPGVGKVIWQGQSGTDSDGFAVFTTRDAGIRAADLNLQTYGKNGFTTVDSIIHRWSSTDQQAYTSAVSQGLGVGPSTTLDLANPSVRQNVLAQIFNFEGSGSRYSGGTLADSWDAIQTAVNNGNPLEIPGAVLGAVGEGVSNVLGDAATAVTGAVTDGAKSVFNFDLGQWIADQANGAFKDYLIPISLGLGAIILIMVSSWGLVKDTPVGAVVKSGTKVARAAALA